MAYLANMYSNGQGGLPEDEAQAVSWIRKAVEGGSADGMAYLGSMYQDGLVERFLNNIAIQWIVA